VTTDDARRAYNRAYYLANRERLRSYWRAYYLAHKEHKRETMRAYMRKHRVEQRNKQRERYPKIAPAENLKRKIAREWGVSKRQARVWIEQGSFPE